MSNLKTTKANSSDSAAKKDIQKLQRVIIDALEDVKAQELKVFDTEQQTAMFERVIIASGTSNRQTRALAMSVRDAVSKAGFPKPRIEGEDNGEWIIIDCGTAVVHVMQPVIRSYYNLEELWGDTPVRLKFGAEKVAKPKDAAPAKTLTAAQTKIAKEAAAKPTNLRRSNAAKTGVAEAFPSKAAIKKEAAIKATKAAAAKKAPAKKAASKTSSASTTVTKVVVGKDTVKKAAAKKAPAKVAAKKAPAKKSAAKK